MAFRLRNQNRQGRTLSLNAFTWYSLLELAEAYGWQPAGVFPTLPSEQGSWSETPPNGRRHPVRAQENILESSVVRLPLTEDDELPGDYGQEGLVTLDDALNLAEALEQAFIAYEPLRLPSLHVLPWLEDYHPILQRRPGVGALLAMIDFCRLGAFTIEKRQ